LAAAEGIHANDVHSLIVLTGNCTSMEGALYDATVKRSHRYHVVKVTGDPDNPERSSRMDLDYCRELIADYGRNDPVVMINVLGEFPPTGIARLLGPADIEKACKRVVQATEWSQEVKVAAVDVARQGLDSSVYTLRQGPVHFEQTIWRIPDLMVLADQVAMKIQEDQPDALIVLATGIGWGLVDRLNQLGYQDVVIAIDEGTEALEPNYSNRRAEMWWNCAEWVKHRGHLLQDAELHADLTAIGYRHRFVRGATRLLLDPGEDIRARLGRSPDKGTSLAGTFAVPVAPRGLHAAKQRHQREEPYEAPWERVEA
jgi:phage terminase large subunit